MEAQCRARKKKRKKINGSDLQHPSGSAVYVNEHLCAALNPLLGARVDKKECECRYVCTKNENIMARKSKTSSIVQITCTKDILRIVA